MLDRAQLLEDLIDIGLALTSERDLHALLERILELARRFTRAEAGTLFLREGDHLRFAVVQNDFLEARLGKSEMQRRLQAAPMALSEPSLAGHVAQTGELINVSDAYAIGVQQTVAFNRSVDASNAYGTRSVFVVPIQDAKGNVVGVLELLNALDEGGAIVPFDHGDEKLVRALASQAAIAIRNARLEDLSFKDGLTELYNGRYFALRLDEEAKRSARFGHPLSLACLDLDGFTRINDDKGRAAGDEVLKETARLLVKHSRSFTILARRAGDDFVAILANTPKAGAVTYAERIRGVIEQHPFAQGPVTACLGVAALPADAASAEDLMAKADRAVGEAKRLGPNRVTAL
ncbi:MAG TPA: sensor domain-containing diguanylate cyclase [Methylomirabilota bacterium]|nr:sensor domain-containing diguanylate cyclase [Methylomirabilota bacterium]